MPPIVEENENRFSHSGLGGPAKGEKMDMMEGEGKSSGAQA